MIKRDSGWQRDVARILPNLVVELGLFRSEEEFAETLNRQMPALFVCSALPESIEAAGKTFRKRKPHSVPSHNQDARYANLNERQLWVLWYMVQNHTLTLGRLKQQFPIGFYVERDMRDLVNRGLVEYRPNPFEFYVIQRSKPNVAFVEDWKNPVCAHMQWLLFRPEVRLTVGLLISRRYPELRLNLKSISGRVARDLKDAMKRREIPDDWTSDEVFSQLPREQQYLVRYLTQGQWELLRWLVGGVVKKAADVKRLSNRTDRQITRDFASLCSLFFIEPARKRGNRQISWERQEDRLC